jgi:two-component system sensor histidine kinase HydH
VKIGVEELGKLTGELAHEIKNPLSSIKINLKLVREDLEGAKCAEANRAGRGHGGLEFTRALRKIAVIEKETDRLEQILEDFLHYIDRTELQPADVDISSLLSDMIDFYSPQARSHSIIMRQQLYDKPLICKADEGMLKQVVLNLFINAQQAMSEGGELLIRTAREKKEAVIPAAVLRRISCRKFSMCIIRPAHREADLACRLQKRLSRHIKEQ